MTYLLSKRRILLKMKYKKEYPKLIKLGRINGLVIEQLYFLLALREVESGSGKNEFNIKAVKDTSFEEQALWAIGSIKENTNRWHRYILDQSHMSFTTFFVCLGGPYRSGWHKGKIQVDKLNKTIERIKNGFETDS